MLRRIVRDTVLLTLLSAAVASAQEVERAAAPRGEELSVYLMTMGPGEYVWERFGHNAIRIRDAARGTDVAYNYGMFSFEQENFLLRFIRGQMDYWMEGFDAGLTADAYVRAGRSVWMQELDLTPAQRADLRDFLEWNARPENRVYRYDYYRDNCSTRVRDALDLVLGGRIREQTASLPTGRTYRDHTEFLTAQDALLYTGLMLGLGQPVDREISAWEEMFLPMELREWAREVSLVGADGAVRPLVRAEETVYLAPADQAGAGAARVPNRVGAYAFLGVLLGSAVAASGVFARRRRIARLAFRALAGGWGAIAGVLGLVLVGLWAFTDHQVAYRNENLLQVNPLHLGLAVLLPLAAATPGQFRRAAFGLASLVATLSVFGLMLKAVPGFDQNNAGIVALMLPVNIAALIAAWWLRREGETRVGAAERARPPASPEPVR